MFDKRLLKEALKLKHYVVLIILMGIGTGFLAAAQSLTLSRIINEVFLNGKHLEHVAGMLWALLFVTGLRSAFVWIVEYFTRRGAGNLKFGLQKRILEAIAALGPVGMKTKKTGELMGTFSEGLSDVEVYFSEYLPQVSLSALTPLVILAFVFPSDLLSGVIMLGTAILIPVFMLLIGKWGESLNQKRWEKLSVMSAHFLEVLRGLTTLKLFGRSKSQTAVISRVSEDFRKTTMEVLRVSFLSALVLELAATISTAVVAVTLGLRLLYGHITFERAFFLLLLAPEFYQPLRLLGQKFHAGMGGKAAAESIYSLISRIDRTEGPVEGSADIVVRDYKRDGITIVFDKVSFSYKGESRQALSEVSFNLEPGKMTVLAGPSGAGKSTVVSLLLRFIEPCGGSVLINGEEMSTIPKNAWHQWISYIPQQPYLFYGTVYENILIGRPEATYGDVLKAASASGADIFIRELPKGYDTFIGEGGALLSAGQRQLIAIARAFLKDAPVVVLDEATSALDTRSEARIKEAIGALSQGRTVLAISHRLSLMEGSDRILILEDGRLVEQGSHVELIQKKGIWEKMMTVWRDSA